MDGCILSVMFLGRPTERLAMGKVCEGYEVPPLPTGVEGFDDARREGGERVLPLLVTGIPRYWYP